MKLKSTVLASVKKSKRLRTRLALGLDKHFATINRYVSENESNGDLTTATALKIISEELKLTQDEILEEPELAPVNK